MEVPKFQYIKFSLVAGLTTILLTLIISRGKKEDHKGEYISSPEIVKYQNIYDSLFEKSNYIEYWYHDLWEDENWPEKRNYHYLLDQKYYGAFTTQTVELRNQPSVKPYEQKSIIKAIIPDSSYAVIQWSTKNPNPFENWFNVFVKGKRGWINGKYLRPLTIKERLEIDKNFGDIVFSFVLEGDSVNARKLNLFHQFIPSIFVLFLGLIINSVEGFSTGKRIMKNYTTISWTVMIITHMILNVEFYAFQLVPSQYFIYISFVIIASLFLNIFLSVMTRALFILVSKGIMGLHNYLILGRS